MTAAPVRARPAVVVGLLIVMGLAVAGCGGDGPSPSPDPASTSDAGPAATTDGGRDPAATTDEEPAVASPLEGVVIRLASEGLTRVRDFRLRTAAGREVELVVGVLENAVEFPPAHLAEHMAAGTRIRVFFRDEGGAHVVYRLEDAAP